MVGRGGACRGGSGSPGCTNAPVWAPGRPADARICSRRPPGRGSGEAVTHLHAADGAAARVATSVAGEVPPGSVAVEPAVVDAFAGGQAAAAGVADDGACLEPARVGCLPRRAEVRRDGGLQVECGRRFVLSWAVARGTAARPAGLPRGTASREAERTRVRARRSVPSEARFRFDSVAGQRSAAPRRPSRPPLVRSPRDVRAPADLNACRADAAQLPTPEEFPMSLDGHERAIDSAGSLSSRRTSPERGQRRLRHGQTSAVSVRKRRRQPAAPRQESLGVYPGVCLSGCLRPAQDVVPVGASPELPENADRVASVLRHAGSALPPTRPARRIGPSVP